MAKDYNKRHYKSGNNFSRQFLTALSFFLIGYLTATFFDLTEITQRMSRLTATHTDKKSASTPNKADAPKPKFEFYTLLSKDNNRQKEKVFASKQPSTALTNNAVTTNPAVQGSIPSAIKTVENKTATAVTHKDTYIIQVAAFNHRAEAETLKASLVLRGFDTTITAFTQKNSTWYRVILGPYFSQAEAEKAQTNLARNDRIKGMIRKVTS